MTAKLGHDLVTCSGDTLLGADDKAGVAAIMAAVARLAADPQLPRPRLRIAFTPDEEIGAGRFAVRHRALRRAVRVHDRRLRDGAAPGRDVQCRRGDPDRPRRRRAPRSCHGQARQRAAACREDRRGPAGRHAGARDDVGARGIHPPLQHQRHARRGAGDRDRARLRRRAARAPRGAARSAPPRRSSAPSLAPASSSTSVRNTATCAATSMPPRTRPTPPRRRCARRGWTRFGPRSAAGPTARC